ncbi:hypothetical protein [Variovorax sp. HJSM1_2]|uniref:hypothetical protein n=1 Tax=Variovorax sp. HJSM1_2 TaxID=3366263 RepID=UPI003BE0FE36
MYLEDTSFDAVITDKNGLTLEVDCRVSEPAASGLPASISIEIPLRDKEQGALQNPCALRGTGSGFEIEIKELWYRSIPVGGTSRKHARGTFDINHAGHLWVSQSHWRSERARLRFLLSPVRFFKKHSSAAMVNYAATPNMTVELFKLQTVELGEIRFIKYWSVHHVDHKGVAAEIRASFAAEVSCDELTETPVEQLVEKMKSVLIPLSLLTRQAITLHGWLWEKREGVEAMWFVPLDPNLAPDMAEEPVEDVCFPREFDAHAQALVDKFLRALPETQEAITLISVALAPHVKRSTAGNFSALFSALEQVIALDRLTKEERKRLRESDAEVIAGLLDLKSRVEATSSPNAVSVAARIEGFAKSVEGSGPSFNVRFEKFQAAHPKLAGYMSDLWPLRGTAKLPGLKQIRDSIAHGLRQEYSMHAIAVAHWHFARLAERLAFVVLDLDVPRGLRLGSHLLRREQWYDRSEWEAVRAAAKRKS